MPSGCSSIAGMYAQLGGQFCHGYMCIVLYLKLIWCNGFTDISASLEAGGVNLPWVYVHCSIYIYRSAMRCPKFGVAVLQLSILYWGGSLPWVFVHCAIYETYVVSWFCRDLCSIGGGSICHRYMCIVLYIHIDLP